MNHRPRTKMLATRSRGASLELARAREERAKIAVPVPMEVTVGITESVTPRSSESLVRRQGLVHHSVLIGQPVVALGSRSAAT